MPKMIVLECDCGCGKKCESLGPLRLHETLPQGRWFIVSQAQIGERSISDTPLLDRELYFFDISCLLRWTKKAHKEIPGILKRASQMAHGGRGKLGVRDLPGIYVS